MPYRLRTRADQDRLLIRIYTQAQAFARGSVNRADIDDVAGDVVLYCAARLRSRAWRKLPGNLQALVRAMVKARVADIRRRARVAQGNEPEVFTATLANEREWVSADHPWDEAAIDEYQAEVMKKLPLRCRQAYHLVRVEGDSYEQAAERMRVSPSTICNHVVRAHRVFREELQRIGAALPEGEGSSLSPQDMKRSPGGEPRTRGPAARRDRNALRAVGAAALSMHANPLSSGGKMQLKQSSILQGCRDIQKFLDEQAEELPGLGETGMRKKFDDLVAQLSRLAATQSSSNLAALSVTKRIETLTQDLIKHHMSHIARIAAVELPPGPELMPLSMPNKPVAGERLVARARGMATQAQKFESTFVAAGLPKDFIAQLRGAADSLSALFSARKQNVADRGAATKLLLTNIREVRKVVKVLDGFVKTTARDNPRVLVTWKILKRLRQDAVASPDAGVPDADHAAQTPTGAAA